MEFIPVVSSAAGEENEPERERERERDERERGMRERGMRERERDERERERERESVFYSSRNTISPLPFHLKQEKMKGKSSSPRECTVQ